MTTKSVNAVASAGALAFTKGLILGRAANLKRTDLDTLALRLTGERRRITPSISTFPTWVNQQAATFVDVAKYGAVIQSVLTPGDDTGRLNGRVKSVPVGSNWKCVFRVCRFGNMFNYNSVSLGLRDSVGGKVKTLAFGPWYDGSLIGQSWNSYSSFNSLDMTFMPTGQYGEPLTHEMWIRITYDGTTYSFDISPDGVVWATYLPFAGTFFANPADQVGVFVNPKSHYALYEADYIGMALLHYNEE